MYIILVLIILPILSYIYLTWNNDYWKKRKVPFEKPSFLFGNFKDVVTGETHIWLKYVNLYRKFKDYPYVGYYKLNEPAIIIRDPDLVRDVLIKDFDSFADNDFRVNRKIDHIWAANAFIQTGQDWLKTRKTWTHAMTTSKIKSLYEPVNKKTEVLVNYIKEHFKNNPDEPLEPREMSAKFFTDAVVDAIFGIKIDTLKNPQNKFFRVSRAIFDSSYYACLVTFTFMVIPWLGNLLRFRFVSQEMENDLMSVSRDILETRKKNGFQKNNSLDAVLIHKERKEGEAITELEMARALFGFLLDATETSSGISGFFLHTLATYPDVQNKLRQEIMDTLEINNGELSYEIVNHNMPYLEMVLSETFRHHPPLLGLQRLCTKPYTLPPPVPGADPVKVPKGMSVIVPVYALHMDPEYYPDPEKFIPERYTEENRKNHRKYTYMPFGEGPRICLGTRMAVNNMKIMMIALVKNFEIKLAPKMVGKPIVTDPYVLPKRNKGDLWVTFHEIKN